MSSLAIEAGGLVKLFGSTRAVDGVDLSVSSGSVYGVLGPNGAGKTTTIRMLATLLAPDSGSARVFGHDVVREARAVRRLVNRVSVEAAFFKRMSAAENLSYASRFYGLAPSETRRRIPEILAAVGFPTARSNAPMEDLSRGMQQKVALARALLTSPALLLLDEPTTGLDPRSKREVQEFVRTVRGTHDTTTLLCTHDMPEADALADRVGILDGGRLIALDTAAALRRRYGAATLEDAFMAATGRALEDDDEEAA
jgi:ABC-2 type transport system ATP-binding protein